MNELQNEWILIYEMFKFIYTKAKLVDFLIEQLNKTLFLRIKQAKKSVVHHVKKVWLVFLSFLVDFQISELFLQLILVWIGVFRWTDNFWCIFSAYQRLF